MSHNFPAFPRPASEISDGSAFHVESAQTGMTLRDYFAAHAMQALIAVVVQVEQPMKWKELAERSYNVADAMLKAR